MKNSCVFRAVVIYFFTIEYPSGKRVPIGARQGREFLRGWKRNGGRFSGKCVFAFEDDSLTRIDPLQGFRAEKMLILRQARLSYDGMIALAFLVLSIFSFSKTATHPKRRIF